MRTTRLILACAIATTMVFIAQLDGQAQTIVPAPVPGAKPVTVQHINEVLDSYQVANSFEICSGAHTSAVADRFQNHVMPFFSKNLRFSEGCH